jgi:hypothetical protein
MRPAIRSLLLTLGMAVFATPAAAQTAAPAAPRTVASRPAPAAKRPLTQDTYDSWKAIAGPALSPDGRWAVYTLTPVVGDGELVVRSTQGRTEYRVPRGHTGRPQRSVTGQPWSVAPARFTADSRHVVALTWAQMAEFEGAYRAKRRANQMPKASLAIVSLADGQVARVPRVKSFELASRAGRHLVYHLEPADSAAASADSVRGGAPATPAAAAAPGGTPRPVADSTAGRRKKETGSTLVIRELASGAETRVEGVTEYAVDERGEWVAYAVSTKDGARDGAYVRALDGGAETALLTGVPKVAQLAFDERGRQIAFLADGADSLAKQPRFALYHATLPAGKATAVVSGEQLGGDVVRSE